jgi:F-type H+-transporting ATPase subunit a
LPNGVTELFQWPDLFGGGTFYALNKTGVLALVSTVICIGLFAYGGSRKKLVPTGVQNVAEIGYEFVDTQISEDVIGHHDGPKWTPFLGVMFFFIFFMNIWSTVPFVQFPATSRIAIPALLAIVSWVVFIGVGFYKQGPLYIFKAIFPPGVPKALLIIVGPIEFLSKFIVRPFSLAVRLFANMFAGHILVSLFALMCAELWAAHSGWYQKLMVPLPLAALIAFVLFELMVAFLQAFIFTLLTAVYIGESLSEEH